jgi:phosphoglycolate phosphatase-like HAD superfamily hydrolase
MKRTALLFDLDGTLVDSVPDLAAALGAMLACPPRAPANAAEMQARHGGCGATRLKIQDGNRCPTVPHLPQGKSLDGP